MHKIKKVLFYFLVLGFAAAFSINSASAQYWHAMPPYNLLWPLWSQALSPVDAISGVSTPLVTTITASTQLPVAPAWVWQPERPYPLFLYNAPLSLGGGLCIWDLLTGFSTFPPQIPTAVLPLGYETIIPSFGVLDFSTWANQANLTYLSITNGILDALTYNNLLQPYALWGVPPF